MATDRTASDRGVIFIVEPKLAGAAWLTLAAQCASTLGAASLVIGTGDDARTARAAGLRVLASCAPPLGRPSLGWRAMQRLCAPHAQGRMAICWGPVAGASGARVAARTVIVSPAAPGNDARKVLAAAAARPTPVEVLPFDAPAALGWPRGRAWRVHAPCAAVPRVPDGRAAGEDRRSALRRAWRLSDDTFAVGLVAGPASSGDAMRGLDIVGRLALLGVRTALILHPGAHRASAAVRAAAGMPHVASVQVSDALGDAWHCAPGLDAGLVAASAMHGAAVEALALVQQGVPLVAPAAATAASLAGIDAACQYQPSLPNSGAKALQALARARAHHAFSQQSCVQSLPDAEVLVERLQALLGGQRAAA